MRRVWSMWSVSEVCIKCVERVCDVCEARVWSVRYVWCVREVCLKRLCGVREVEWSELSVCDVYLRCRRVRSVCKPTIKIVRLKMYGFLFLFFTGVSKKTSRESQGKWFVRCFFLVSQKNNSLSAPLIVLSSLLCSFPFMTDCLHKSLNQIYHGLGVFAPRFSRWL